MQLNFNLESVNYLKVEYIENSKPVTTKFAMKEKRENEFIAITSEMDITGIRTPQKVALSIVCPDGLYKTITELKDVENKDGNTYFVINNPITLDYQQNREYYRVLADYDCIYTVYHDDGAESYNATTYDISAGGVSIIMEENIISTDECSILIFIPGGDLKSHLEFVRCEVFDKNFKLSFKFTDLSDRDYERLQKICVDRQLR